jgi:Bacterial cadherin-like domain
MARKNILSAFDALAPDTDALDPNLFSSPILLNDAPPTFSAPTGGNPPVLSSPSLNSASPTISAPTGGDPPVPSSPILNSASPTISAPTAGDPPNPDPKLCAREIVFTIPGAPGVTITGVEDGAGNLDFTATENNTASLVGDLGGLFFQLNDTKLGGLTVTGPTVTLFKTGDDNVLNIAPGINMNGAQPVGYDVGVEFGTAGIGADHQDITSASFVVSNAAHNLTLDDLLQAGETNLFGARVTAIGVPGGPRETSEKITGDATQPITAKPDSISTLEDFPVTIKASDLVTDPNPNGGALTITEVTQPGDGTVTIAPDGSSLTFTPGDFVPNGTNIGSFQYCVHDALGSEDSNTISTTVTPVADPPTVGVKVLAPQTGDPVTETRLLVTANSGDFGTLNEGSDFIKSIQLPGGVTLTDAQNLLSNGTINTSGQPGTFTDEIDVFAPSGQSTNFNLGITAFNDETEGSAENSASTSQPIVIDYSTVSQNLDFLSTNQSIWTSGTQFSKTFDNFLGIDFPNNFPSAPPTGGQVGGLGVTLTGHFGLKAGFQSDLTVNSGAFNGQLPFNVTLADTFNKTNNTLEILPTESQQGGGSFTTTGAGGSFELALIFDVFANASVLSNPVSLNIDKTLLNKKSSTLNGSFDLPDGLGNVAFNWPQVNTTGSNPNPGTIPSTGASKPIFELNVDPIAVVLDAILGHDPLKGTFGNIPPAQIKYTILAATLAPGVDVQQSFNLNPGNLMGTLTNGNGSTIPFSFGMPTILDNPSSTNFNLSLDPNAMLKNDTSLAGQLRVGLSALKASITVGFTVAGQNVTKSVSVGPLFNPTHTFGPAPFATLYTNTFPVAFQQQTVSFSAA